MEDVKLANLAYSTMSIEELQLRWTAFVVANMTSAKFHSKVIEEKLNFLRFVDNELGYDLKHYVCVACDMLIHKI